MDTFIYLFHFCIKTHTLLLLHSTVPFAYTAIALPYSTSSETLLFNIDLRNVSATFLKLSLAENRQHLISKRAESELRDLTPDGARALCGFCPSVTCGETFWKYYKKN